MVEGQGQQRGEGKANMQRIHPVCMQGQRGSQDVGLTQTVAAPPLHLSQEGGLVCRSQRDLPVTQLLPQAAVQQAQHHVVGGTGPLGERDALRLCPTHTLLSTKSLLLPQPLAQP